MYKRVLSITMIFSLFSSTIFAFDIPYIYLINKLINHTEKKVAPSYIGLISIKSDLESAKNIIHALLQLQLDPHAKGILVHIDCFGGKFGTTQAIFNEIKKIKQIKPVIVIIENTCHSCAYYLATAGDFIFALPSSTIGCIGVIRMYKKYKDLKFHGNEVSGSMETIIIKSGEFKDSGCYAPLEDEQKKHIEQNNQKIYKQFIADVAQARGLSLEDEKIWADGKEFVGTEALELGLIDALGGFTDALEKMKELLLLRGINVASNLKIQPIEV